MKKLVISLFITILALGGYAQEMAFYTYKNDLRVKNRAGEYILKNSTYADITFYVSSGYVRVGDQKRSLYRVISEKTEINKDNYKSTTWKCLDENNTKCLLSIMKSKVLDQNFIYIVYDDVSFLYYIE